MKPEINAELLRRLKQKQQQQSSMNSDRKREYEDTGVDRLWIRGQGRYVFRLIPLSKDDYLADGSIFPLHIDQKHYNLGKEEKEKAVCVEDGLSDAVCPICEAIRELNELGIQSPRHIASVKYVFKVLMLQTPEKAQDELPMDRVTLLYVTKYTGEQIIEKYMDNLCPPIFDANKACAIVCERDNDTGWKVSLLDTSMPQCGLLGFTQENCDKLLEISEKNPFSKLFRTPSDDTMAHYKELAKEFKMKKLKAKTAEVDAIKETKELTKSVELSAPPPEKIEVTKPVESPVVEETVVVTPSIPASVEEVKEPKLDVKDDSSEYFDVPLNTEQKALLDSYRGKCKEPCFGSMKQYDPKCEKCMYDPFSTQCALAIKAVFGKEVPLF